MFFQNLQVNTDMMEIDLMSLIIINDLLLCQNKICELEETKPSSVIKELVISKGW